jgi:hypothetical protein
MGDFNIVELIENNPITKLNNTYNVNLSEAGVSPVIHCSFHTFSIMTSIMKSLLIIL